MTQRVLLSLAAQRDVVAARDWYADLEIPGLDRRFQEELDAVLLQVERFPSAFPLVYGDIRQANLRRFPYGVFYRERGEDQLYVQGVIHHARHPRTWRRRR